MAERKGKPPTTSETSSSAVRPDAEDGVSKNDLLSRGAAARLLGVHPRSVGRMREEGVLQTTAEGLYYRAQIDKLLEEKDEASGDGNTISFEVVEALKQARDHNERLLAMLEKPMKVLIEGLTLSQSQHSEQSKLAHDAYLENSKMMGEMLLNKEERDAVRTEAARKADLLGKTADKFLAILPILVNQAFSKKPTAETGSASNPIKDFFDSLEPAEKAAIAGIGSSFDGEKKVKFDLMLAMAGIAPPATEKPS